MAITSAIEIADLTPVDGTSKELAKLKEIIAKDNVKDLSKAKKDKFDAFAKKQNKTNLDNPDNKNPGKDFIDDNALDERVEQEFDKYLLKLGENDAKGTLNKLYTGNITSLQNDFNKYLQDFFADKSQFSQYMKILEDAEIKEALKPFSFELNALSQDVIASLDPKIVSGQGNSSPTNTNQNNNQNQPQNSGDKTRNKFEGNVADANEYIKTQGGRGKSKIQYAADVYTNKDFKEEDDLSDTDQKTALKRILKGKSEALDIVDRNYDRSGVDRSATNKLTRILLRIGGKDVDAQNIINALKKVSEDYSNGTQFNESKGWKDRAREYGSKDEYRLGILYQIAQENTPGYPYLKRVMGLLVQEFLREDITVTTADGTEKTKDFVDIYNEHNNMPTSKTLDLVTRKGQAIRAIETGTFSQKQQIRKLLNLADDVDVAFLTSGTGENLQNLAPYDRIYAHINTLGRPLSKEEKKLIDLCKANQNNENFNYVLQGLMSGMTIQELANAGNITVEIDGDEKKQEHLFVERFADTSFDGMNNFADKDMVKGLQFQNIYNNVVLEMGYKNEQQNKPLINILSFGKALAEKTGNTVFATKLTELLKDPSFQKTNSEFNNKMNVPLLRFLQKSLMGSPLPVSDILKYGPDAYQNFYNNSLELPGEWKTKVENRLKSQIPNIDNYLDPVTKEGVIQAVTSFITTQQSGAGVAMSLNVGNLANSSNAGLDYFLSGLNINFGLGVTASDSPTGVLGLSLSRDKARQTGKNSAFSAGVSNGVNLAAGFIPMVILSAGIGEKWQVNRQRLEKQLNAESAKTIHIGVDAMLINYSIPARGVNLGYSVDRMQGIEQQYANIKAQATPIGISSLNAIKDVFGDQNKSLAAIEAVLVTKFGKSTDESIHKAAFNIYKGLMAFNLTKEDFKNPGKLYQVATMLGEFYALAWKNSETTGLKGRKFDNVNVGVLFFAGFFPTPTLSLQWAKYKNLYYEDTKESQALADKAEATGDGNEKYSEIIGEREISLINNTIEVSFLNKKSAINQVDKNNPNQVPDILLDEKNQTIKVPFELWERGILNVNLDPCLKKHISIETDKNGKKYMVVPKDIPVRLFTNSTGTSAEYVLNLGDVKSDGGKKTVVDGKDVFEDVLLVQGKDIPSDWLGNSQTPIFEKITQVDGKNGINDLLTKLTTGAYANFPLRSAAKSTEKGKEQQTVFTLQPQVNGKPDYFVSSPGITFDKTNAKLTLIPDTGELIVNYAKDKNTYTFSYKDEPKDALKISYRINDLTAAEARADNWSTPTKIEFSDSNKLFDFLDSHLSQANTLIEANKKTLMNKEYTASGVVNPQFSKFMENLWEIETNNSIDKGKLIPARTALLSILGKNELATFINGLGDDYKTLAYVMDRMKQVFAMEGYQSSLQTMWGNNKRGDRYHKIPSPSKENFPTSLNRSLVSTKGNITEKFDSNGARLVNNLVGYTAFYRKEGSPAWSMTAPGSTTVYKNFISDPLKDTQLTDGKNRFLKNLNKQTYEKELLLESIKSKIPAEYRDQIKSEDLIAFLNTGEKYITIDNGPKKYRIVLNTTYHFYLLGECANESLGMKVGGIEIQSLKPGTGELGDSNGEVKHGYENSNVGLSINNAQTRNEAFRGKKSTAGINLALGAAKPKSKVETPPPPPPPNSTFTDTPPPPNSTFTQTPPSPNSTSTRQQPSLGHGH